MTPNLPTPITTALANLRMLRASLATVSPVDPISSPEQLEWLICSLLERTQRAITQLESVTETTARDVSHA